MEAGGLARAEGLQKKRTADNGYTPSHQGDGNGLTSLVVMVAQLCDYAQPLNYVPQRGELYDISIKSFRKI